MTHLLVIAKTRAYLDLSVLFSKYEFSVTPRALFSPEGRPWECKDKGSFLRGIEAKTTNITGVDHIKESYDYIIIDCIGLVNQLKISKDMVVLEDLTNQFVKRVKQEIQRFRSVVLVFDRYDLWHLLLT